MKSATDRRSMQEIRLADERAHDTVTGSLRTVILFGALVIVAFFSGLGGWAAVASLQSAAIAPGVLSVESNRKTIQHFEGGIIAEILVHDGDRVIPGQPLIRLDQTQARATLGQLRARYHAAISLEARLVAERNRLDQVEFSDELFAQKDNPKVADSMVGEINIFEARQRALDGQAGILAQRIIQFQKEIDGLEGQIESENQQIALISKEVVGLEELVEKKFSGMQRLLQLQHDEAEVAGERSRHRAAIAHVEQNIAEERLKILELDTQRTNEVVEQLRDPQTLLFDVTERMRAAEDVLARTRIDSPLAGIVVDLQIHTAGGVIAPGAAVMDIVPIDANLIIEAQVNPLDIDSVHPGLKAQVVLTAFNRRNVSPIEGTVIFVSADRLTDQRTGQPYFLARISLPEDPLAAVEGLELYPGMQAKVMIVTGERTTLEYLIKPVTRSFTRALREE
jgi:HlyD family type I secretion membrane fusion protein